jgi:molybdate transport repressor ModE-like protein
LKEGKKERKKECEVREKMALKNRSRVEILYDIVSSARTAAKKTHLMYKSNLSFKQLDLYLEYILQHGLLEERFSDDDGGKLYVLTNKGNEFLRLFEHLRSLLPMAGKFASGEEQPLGSETSSMSSSVKRLENGEDLQEVTREEQEEEEAAISLAKPAFVY